MEWRVRRAVTEVTSIIPQMSCAAKDHKPLPETGVPETRPMCNASASMNQRISDMVSDILGYLFQADNNNVEVTSTEDFLSRIEDLNQQIREGKVNGDQLMVGSLDVEALYPSIDVNRAAEIVKERVMESELRLEGIDWRWMLIYMTLTMTPHEKVDNRVQGILPRRV